MTFCRRTCFWPVLLLALSTAGCSGDDDDATAPAISPTPDVTAPPGSEPTGTPALETPAVSPTPEAGTPSPTDASPTPGAETSPTPGAPPSPTPADTSPTPSGDPTPIDDTTPIEPTPNPLEVTISSGPIRGLEDGQDTYAWLGVPFAAPPIDALRWQPPVDPTPWTEVRDTTALGPACPQLEESDTDGDGENEMYPIGDEDCLYLNIWRPRTDALRPIMVFIHGGGNILGSATDALYYGAELTARADVVLVTIEYRLGFLGYIQDDALHSGDALTDSGTFGTLDVLKALEWVQRNGAAFGGDTSRVTIFGESAGGVNSWAMIQSPLASDLFHGAIVESGCPNYKSVDQIRATTEAWLEQLVVADGLATEEDAAAFLEMQDDAWIRDYLYGKTAEEMLQVSADNGGLSLFTYGPVLDGYVMPEDGNLELVDGTANRVPVIIGSNKDEQKLFYYSLYDMTEAQYQVLMKAVFGNAQDDVEALYPRDAYSPATPYNQFTDIMDYALELTCSPYSAWLVSDDQPTWLYHFEFDDLADSYDYVLGAAHGLELPFVFGQQDSALYDEANLADREALSAQMMDYWGCFAATGDPNCRGGLEWPSFVGSGDPAYQRMVLDVPQSVGPVPDLDWERINFWLDYGDSELPPFTP